MAYPVCLDRTKVFEGRAPGADGETLTVAYKNSNSPDLG